MKRSLSILLMISLCACRTTQSVNDVDDGPDVSRDEQPDAYVENELSPQGRYAVPPPGEPARPQAPAREKSWSWSDDEAQPTRPRVDTDRAPQGDSYAESGVSGHGRASAPSRSLANDAPNKSAPKDNQRGAVASEQPQTRPGLGTQWGETRYSAVSEAPFTRDSAQPSYTATMHYNDYRGATALAGGSSYSRSASLGLGSALTMSLHDEYGNILSAVRGNGRTVAVGENGQRYIISIDNNTNERFEIVLSVDGLDVLDGTDAGYGKRGYLIEAYGHLEIEGFRQSQDAVAAFRFGSVKDSYAARTGSARNVGVIGAAAFGERGYQARLAAYQERVAAIRSNNVEVDRRRNADPFPNRYASPPVYLAR